MVSSRLPTCKSSSLFSNPLVTVPNAPITIGIIVTCMFNSFFFQFFSMVEVLILLFTFFQFYSVVCRDSKVNNFASSLCWLLLGLVFWPRLGDPCVCQSPIGVYVRYFLGQVLGYAYTICLYGQISISCTSPCGSPCWPRCVWSYTFFVLICCIRLLCDWWFGLCHRIAYVCYFVASYLFSLWYDWFLWRCPVLLLGDIPFLS